MEGGDKVQGSVDPSLPSGLPFPMPEIVEFRASHDSGNVFRIFAGIFLELSLKPLIRQTVTAFSSFLIKNIKPREVIYMFVLDGNLEGFQK